MLFAFEIFVLVFLIILSGFFVLSEIAVISSRKARLQHLVNKGNFRAKAALEFAKTPGPFLSTVQVGITLVGILAGAFGEYALAEHIAQNVEQWFPFPEYAHAIALTLVVAMITYFSVVVGELFPKEIALRNPERMAMYVAVPMRVLLGMMKPVVGVLDYSTRILLKVLRIKESTDPSVTEEEIKVMIEEGTKAGTFNEVEQEMVERVFRLSDKHVNALMTPRTDIVWLDVDDSNEENIRKIKESSHSFFPVCKQNIDSVLGVVHVKDLFHRAISGSSFSLEQCVRQPLYVVESMPAVQLIEQFKQSGVHFAFLVDEYGGIQGLITLNDILKAVVGQEISEEDKSNPYVVRRADGSYLIDGALMIDEFKELFNLENVTEEEIGNYRTLAGLVINQMGKIPAAGQFIHWRDLRIEVVDMDGNRIDKLLVNKTQSPAA
jgi:putative hemolysin